jgi:hypothetical protein
MLVLTHAGQLARQKGRDVQSESLVSMLYEMRPHGSDFVPIEGRYANYFEVGSNAVEFMLDFGQYVAGNPARQVVVRIFTNPCYAKEFLQVLQRSVESYEAIHGDIEEVSYSNR